jgi:hypothetical protein
VRCSSGRKRELSSSGGGWRLEANIFTVLYLPALALASLSGGMMSAGLVTCGLENNTRAWPSSMAGARIRIQGPTQ